jgi:hypothetical protein
MIRPDQVLEEGSDLYLQMEDKLVLWISKEYGLLKNRYQIDNFAHEYVRLRVRSLCFEEDLASRNTGQKSISAGTTVSAKTGEQAGIWKIRFDQMNRQIDEAKKDLNRLEINKHAVLIDKPQYFSRI